MLAELDRGARDHRLQQGLAVDERHPPKVSPVEVQHIERHHHDVLGGPPEAVLEHREVGLAAFARNDDLAIDDHGADADQVGVGCDLAEALGPVVAAPGVNLYRTMWSWAR